MAEGCGVTGDPGYSVQRSWSPEPSLFRVKPPETLVGLRKLGKPQGGRQKAVASDTTLWQPTGPSVCAELFLFPFHFSKTTASLIKPLLGAKCSSWLLSHQLLPPVIGTMTTPILQRQKLRLREVQSLDGDLGWALTERGSVRSACTNLQRRSSECCTADR